MSQSDKMVIIYDGECPFCTTYVKFLRLKENFSNVELINAREGGSHVEEAKNLPLNLDEGMALKYQGVWYHGDECLNFLALTTSRINLFNKLTAWLFSSPARSRLIYPWLKFGRNTTLKILGRTKISQQ